MNREEFIKHQEEMIDKLFPPEHRRKVAESAKAMLDDAYEQMEFWHGKDWEEKLQTDLSYEPIGEVEGQEIMRRFREDWRDKAKADCDPKTAFLTELSDLLRKYDARINWGVRIEDRVWGVVLEVNNEGLFYPFKVEDMSDDPAIIYQRPQSNFPLTPDNIFDYEKE